MSRTRKSRPSALYGHYSAAAHRGDLTELLGLVANPDLDIELLAVIAPAIRDKDADAGLISRVLDHPACSEASQPGIRPTMTRTCGCAWPRSPTSVPPT